MKNDKSTISFFHINFLTQITISYVTIFNISRMRTWSEGLDQEFNRMTSGSNDITGAYQLQQVSKEE